MVDFKKLTQKLAKARDEIVEKQEITPEVEKVLESMLPIETETEQDAAFETKTVSGRILTDEQHYRLRLVEKTGTGSTAIH